MKRLAPLNKHIEAELDDISAEIDKRVRAGQRPTVEEYEKKRPHLKGRIRPLLLMAYRLQDAFESMAIGRKATRSSRGLHTATKD